MSSISHIELDFEQFRQSPARYLMQLRHQYSDCFYLKQGAMFSNDEQCPISVAITDGVIAKAVLADSKTFRKITPMERPTSSTESSAVMYSPLISMSPQQHRGVKQLYMQVLKDNHDRYLEMIEKAGHEVLSEIAYGTQINLYELFKSMCSKAVGGILFGENETGMKQYYRFLNTLNCGTAKLPRR